MGIDHVVIKCECRAEGNVHFAISLFSFDSPHPVIEMKYRGDYCEYDGYVMPLYQKHLADALWGGVPGLHSLFFSNEGIALHHGRVLSNCLIVDIATEIIRPVMEQNFLLMSMVGFERMEAGQVRNGG